MVLIQKSNVLPASEETMNGTAITIALKKKKSKKKNKKRS